MNPSVCPICAGIQSKDFALSSDTEYQTSESIFQFKRCNCGVVYLMDPQNLNLESIYPDNYYSYGRNHGVVVKVKEHLDRIAFRQWVSQVSSPVLSLLDVGGGDGVESSTVKSVDDRISKVVVVDINEIARTQVENRGLEFVCTKIENYETVDKFDLVLALNLIEHVANPRSMLSKINSLMSPGGSLLIKTPNVDSLDCRIFVNNNWGGFHTPRHWVLFTEESISNLLAECGFRSIEVKYTQGGPFWAVGISSVLTKFKILRRREHRALTETMFFRLTMPALALADTIRAKLGFRTSQMFVTARK